MSSSRKAGEPAEPQRPAGAPEEARPPAGAPSEEAEAAAAEPKRQVAEPEREATEPEREATAHPAAPASEPSAFTGRPSGDLAEEAVVIDLDALLEEAKRERDEYLELAKRARADFENYRKRAARDASEAGRRGKASLAREMVPVLDNLERALLAAGVNPDAEASAGATGGDGGGLSHGVLLVFRELRATLERAGVEAYDPAGERFDPTLHEALATRPEEDTEPGIVLETVEKGYRLDGQVLRAARVIVSAAGGSDEHGGGEAPGDEGAEGDRSSGEAGREGRSETPEG